MGCYDKDRLPKLGFEIKVVKGDDPMLGESGLAEGNRSNSSTFSFVREGDCEGSKGGEDSGVRGNMESGSGESEPRDLDLGGDVVGVVE